ncbi:MAG: cell envelope integrity protein TolA [Thermodesulfobacteriota bacterium]
MSAISGPSIKIVAPAPALQQMCNYVAIAETKSPAESLRELILHTLFTFEEEKASGVQDVSNMLRIIFGVDVPNHQVQEALDQLVTTGQVHQPISTNYILTPKARAKVKTRIDQASVLQKLVRMQWLAEIVLRFPDLNAEVAWNALQDYLAKAFLRHGIQVAAFLDPSIDLPVEYATSLSTLLAETVQAKFDSTHQTSARHAISDFLASVGKNQERYQFIVECADGAANYFSLAVSPEVAERFREKLSPLTLLCDTNFLFGILDLHVHPLVEVSNELLDAISMHNLPIKLRYHEATLQELQSSISHYGDILRRHRWTQALSRAATTSRFMSGIELKYHQRNAETGVDVDAFLRPYQHVDILLKQRNISIYRPSTNRLMVERATLESEYQEYLKRLHKEKPYMLIAHDVAVLDCVRSLKSNTVSTLEAGALLVTCDYSLYRFDCDISRQTKTQASVVLPNVLWQILRPFIPANPNFDRSFAETFAIPEFRTIGSGAAEACSKMLGLLAAYKDFSEEIAARFLSNDLLIDRLRATQNDEQFQAQVESAIASEYQTLLEERAAMAKQFEALRSDKERVEEELEQQKQLEATEIAKMQETIRTKEKETKTLAASYKDAEEKAKDTSTKLAEMTAAKDAAEKATRQEVELRLAMEASALRNTKIASIIVALLSILTFELVVHNVWKWDWLLRHPNSYGLQGCLCLMAAFGIVGLWVKPWRKALWVTGVFGVLFVTLQILGGPGKTP